MENCKVASIEIALQIHLNEINLIIPRRHVSLGVQTRCMCWQNSRIHTR